MARFYGEVQGGRGAASRLGHATCGIAARVRSYSGDVHVCMSVRGAADFVSISVNDHDTGAGVMIYDGPIADLLDQSARKTMLTAIACDAVLHG